MAPAKQAKPHILLILGIRPDLIRASRMIHMLRARPEVEFTLMWSGQHYSDNLKDVFIRELGLPRPDIELGATGDSDADLVGSVISRLSPVLAEMRPDVVVFLGDTNTVMGCIAAAQLNVPVAHIDLFRLEDLGVRKLIDRVAGESPALLQVVPVRGVTASTPVDLSDDVDLSVAVPVVHTSLQGIGTGVAPSCFM